MVRLLRKGSSEDSEEHDLGSSEASGDPATVVPIDTPAVLPMVYEVLSLDPPAAAPPPKGELYDLPKPRLVFPKQQHFERVVLKEWEQPTRLVGVPPSWDKRYPFAEDLVKLWCVPPVVDSPVLGLSNTSAPPFEPLSDVALSSLTQKNTLYSALADISIYSSIGYLYSSYFVEKTPVEVLIVDDVTYFLNQKLEVKSSFKFEDVLSLEPDYLKTISKPVCAVLFLFPVTPQHKEFRKKQAEELKDKSVDSKVYFIKQKLENSCGILVLIHTAANNQDKLSFGDKSPLKDFLEKSANASPDERAKLLEENKALLSAHNAVASEGQCRPSEDVHFHIVVFTAVNGHLYELDGLTDKPIDHGATSEDSLLQDAAKICKQYTEREAGDVRFTAVAFVKNA
ncbi:ubiquitin carboxyl-terminal hydrolase isozyme L1 [Gastrophryne carolinensis]